MAQKAKAKDFWSHPYTRELNTNGKLAFYYALGHEYDNEPVILEDMATETGLESSECSNWLELFIQQGQLQQATVLL